MPVVEFSSRKDANNARDMVGQYLTAGDDRRSTTVRLKSSTPDRVIERIETLALQSIERGPVGAGKAKLTTKEKQSLKRQHANFSWQKHGFQAMAVKAAMQKKGVDTWQDYYEPGESVDSAVSKLRSAKGGGGRADLGVEGMRTDEAEMGNLGRQARQAERATGDRLESAKDPAIFDQDPDAIEFLREEERLDSDPWDIAFSSSDSWGNPLASGRDADRLTQRHEERTDRAQHLDEIRSAEPTRDPIKWSSNPAKYDFPGIDDVDPVKKHDARPEHAQSVDENELAPIADSTREWAKNPDQFDLPGIDTPKSADVDDLGVLDTGSGDATPGVGGGKMGKPTSDIEPLLDDDVGDALDFGADDLDDELGGL